MTSFRLEHSREVLYNTHEPDACAGERCTLHNRSNHSMRAFPQHWRGDRGIMERICPHGIGHPDPDEVAGDTVHGCDGCCAPTARGECVPCGAPAGGRCRLEGPGECPDDCVTPEAW